jgi:seryl-tRNA(Sec) selenium transferase
MKRRDLIKGLAVLPLAGGIIGGKNLFAAPTNVKGVDLASLTLADAFAVEGPLKVGPQIYQSIGVEPVINCRGTFTIIGGSVELPEVRAAIDAASQYYVQLDELANGVGQRLAELTGAEWGMIPSGCSAGMKHVTAACVTGGNPEKLIRIPNLEGFEKTEVIIPSHSRNVYDHAIRNIGVDIITVSTPEELQSSMNSRTAMIYIMSDNGGPASKGPLSLENIARMAKPLNIPIFVDAAAEILTFPNVHLQQGATVVAYSGGKAIRGPQGAGLLLGNKKILQSAWQASSPHHGPGRDNKVGREETMGMLAAVEAWIKRDHDAEMKTWIGWLNNISKRVMTIPGIKTTLREPTGLGNRTPSLAITWDPDVFHVTGQEIGDELSSTKPRIALSSIGGGGRRGGTADASTGLSISSWMMQPGNDKIVADRIYEALTKKRNPKPKTMKAPVADISGRWDVDINFFSSQGKHVFFIEKQDGNWLSGSHKGDFAVFDMNGTLEGDDVKFRSFYRKPGDGISYTFSGKVSGDTMSGDIHMGEYLTATFTAKKYVYPEMRNPIVVPIGPPLSS